MPKDGLLVTQWLCHRVEAPKPHDCIDKLLWNIRHGYCQAKSKYQEMKGDQRPLKKKKSK